MTRKPLKKLLALALCAGLMGGIALAQDEGANDAEPEAVAAAEHFNANLMASLHSQPELSRFADLLTRAGLDARLNDGGTYTVFALTNSAVAELAELYDLDSLSDFELTSITHSFILDGTVTPEDLAGLEETDSMGGYTYAVSADGSTITVDEAKLDTADAIVTDSGVIYVLNKPFKQVSDYLNGLPAQRIDSSTDNDSAD